MGEIDDNYAEESEALDIELLDKLKKNEDHEESFAAYQKKLGKSREKFTKKYDKLNAAETKRLQNMKKKFAKHPKFKHLNVAHFNFEFNFWERTKMKWEISLFNGKRSFNKIKNIIIPSWLIYEWCKVHGSVGVTWRDFVEDVNASLERLKKWGTKTGLSIWETLKAWWGKVSILSGKILFWKKAKKVEDKEGGKEGEEKKEGGEEGEEKKEEGEEKKED